MSAPVISVVIVNWNSGPHLAALLDSLAAQPAEPSWEAVVVDNASTDGSAELGQRAGVRVIRQSTNTGLAAANNIGMAATDCPYILIANPDVVLPDNALANMVAVMQRHPRAAWVVPRLVSPDGTIQTSAGDLPALNEAFLGRRLGSRWAGRDQPALEGRGYWWHGWPHTTEQPIGRGAEACFLVRRAAVEEIGPQDPRYRLDWEGVEWTARARAAGWEVWLDPATTVIHVGGVSISQARLRWVVESHVGMYRYFAGRMRPAARPLLAAAVAGRALAKLGATLLGAPLYDRAHRVGAGSHPGAGRAGRVAP